MTKLANIGAKVSLSLGYSSAALQKQDTRFAKVFSDF